jgi:hypothetical protein
LEMLLNDEKATTQQLNKLCCNENNFSYTWVSRRKMLVDVTLGGVVLTPEVARDGVGVNRDNSVRSKILTHLSLWFQGN